MLIRSLTFSRGHLTNVTRIYSNGMASWEGLAKASQQGHLKNVNKKGHEYHPHLFSTYTLLERHEDLHIHAIIHSVNVHIRLQNREKCDHIDFVHGMFVGARHSCQTRTAIWGYREHAY